MPFVAPYLKMSWIFTRGGLKVNFRKLQLLLNIKLDIPQEFSNDIMPTREYKFG
jgi:hypothetical protein